LDKFVAHGSSIKSVEQKAPLAQQVINIKKLCAENPADAEMKRAKEISGCPNRLSDHVPVVVG